MHDAGGDSETSRDGNGQTFRDKGNGDTDTADDEHGHADPAGVLGAEPRSPDNQDDGDHGDHDGTDDDDKVEDLALKSGHLGLGLVGQIGDPAKDGAVTSADDDTSTRTRSAVSSLKANVLGLQVVIVGRVDSGRERDGFTSQDGPVKPSITRDLEEANVSRKFVSSLDSDDVSGYQLESRHGCLLSITNDETVLGQHVLDALHDPG